MSIKFLYFWKCLNQLEKHVKDFLLKDQSKQSRLKNTAPDYFSSHLKIYDLRT